MNEHTTLPTTEIVFSSDSIQPGNLAINSQNRIFVSINPFLHPTTKLYELNEERKKASPYPNDEFAVGKDSIIKGTLGVRVDSHDNLWILDMNDRKFIIINTIKNDFIRIVRIPTEVTRPNSFLQDFVIDEKHQRIIIADMTLAGDDIPTYPAFVVYDMENGGMTRMAENHTSLKAELEGGFDLNPIAIDPKCEWVFFGAVHSHQLYRVPADTFDKEENLVHHIEEYAPKSYCDGISADDNGNVYITNVEDLAIGVANTEGFKNIALLPQGQSWPDGLYISHDGYVYNTISQLDRIAYLNDGVDKTVKPYLIVRTPLIS